MFHRNPGLGQTTPEIPAPMWAGHAPALSPATPLFPAIPGQLATYPSAQRTPASSICSSWFLLLQQPLLTWSSGPALIHLFTECADICGQAWNPGGEEDTAPNLQESQPIESDRRHQKAWTPVPVIHVDHRASGPPLPISKMETMVLI